jgi:hypothetical protein
MGREVRMVPPTWEHPKDERGRYIPKYPWSYAQRAAEWDEARAKWEAGDVPDYVDAESRNLPFDQWEGARPMSDDYMPDWPAEERTHCQMYENTSEGTPISPIFATPEELARWLVDNGASSFANMTATYEQWLRVCKGGFAPSAMLTMSGAGVTLVSGVEALAGEEP